MNDQGVSTRLWGAFDDVRPSTGEDQLRRQRRLADRFKKYLKKFCALRGADMHGARRTASRKQNRTDGGGQAP
jgi:hypothetical protein